MNREDADRPDWDAITWARSKVSRRELLRSTAAGGFTLASAGLLAACGSSSSSGSGSASGASSAAAASGSGTKPVKLTFVSYGGDYQKAITEAFLDPYMKANPHVTILQDSPTDYSKLEAMVKTGNVTWDLVDVGEDGGLGSASGYLTDINCSVIDCAHNTGALATKWRTPFMTASLGLAYRKDKVSRPPKDWADFFDLKTFPGKRGLWQLVGQSGIFEYALLADGVPADKLYPIDVKRAFAKLDTIKPEIVWWQDLQQSISLLANGTIVMGGSTPNGRVQIAQKDGVPIEYVWNQANYAPDFLVIPKGSPNAAEALKLMQYITSAAHNAQLSYKIPYAPTNTLAYSKVDPANKSFLPTSHTGLFRIDDQFYDKTYNDLNQQFQQWLQS